MNSYCRSLILLSLLCGPVFGNAQQIPATIGKSNFIIGEVVQIRSTVLQEDRTLNIYLPANYHGDSLKHYPVIYLLDGSADEDFIHISGLVQFGTFPWIKMLPESIVVGIGNVDRKRDFTYPSQNKADREKLPTSGKSGRFMAFIREELQPYIDSGYRTSPVKTLIGQSLGGLLATEILYKHPDLFNNYIIVSPSLWWDDDSLLTWQPGKSDAVKSVYIAVGKEGEIMERPARDLYLKVKDLYDGNTRIYFKFFEDLDHGDILHLAVYDAFEKIFRLPEDR